MNTQLIVQSLLICLFLPAVSFSQNVGVDVASPVEKLDVAGAIRVGNTTNANAGTLRWTGTAFEGYNGSAWLNLGSPGGITSLNTLTGAVQTFAIGTAGTAPAFSPAGTVHTLNIPFASTSGVTGGILSNTQYTTLLNGILPSGLTGQTLRHNGTTWVANSVIYNDGTNVGIGQTPGAAYLDVAGTNGGTTSLQLRSGNPGTGGTSSQITFGYNGTENYRQAIKTRHQSSGTSNAIDFYVWDQPNDVATTIGTLNVMSITGLNNGSVGIGVNAPGAQLHTTGSVRFAGLSAASQTSAVMTDGSGNLSTRALNPVAFSGTLANHTAGTGLSGSVYDGSAAQTWSVVYGTTAGTAVQGNQAATITAGNGLTGGISADALGDGFTSTLDVGAGTAIQVNADDIAVKFDNSTITTNGSGQLQVAYGSTAATAVQGNQTATITAGNGLTGGISADALGDGFTSSLAVGAGTAIQVNADDIAVKFDNSTITTNGSGQLQVANIPSGDGDYIQNLAITSNFATGQSASLDIQSNAEIGGTMFVNNSIAIGTTTAGSPLEIVKSGGNSAMFRNTNSASYSGIRFYNDQNVNVRALEIDYSGSAYASSLMSGGVTGEAGSIATTGAYPLMIGTSNTLRLLIAAGGNVGIGSISPGTKLDVTGTVRAGTGINTGGFTTGDRIEVGSAHWGVEGMDYNSIETYGGMVVRGNSIHVGSLAVGMWVSASYALDVAGQTRCTNGVWLSSDSQYKKEIKPIESALSNLSKVEGVTYYWKADEFKDMKFTNTLQYGVIAQELEKIYPDMVSTDTRGSKSVNYTMLTPVLLEAIKEQQRLIDSLKTENIFQKSQISNLTSEMKSVKEEINAIKGFIYQKTEK